MNLPQMIAGAIPWGSAFSKVRIQPTHQNSQKIQGAVLSDSSELQAARLDESLRLSGRSTDRDSDSRSCKEYRYGCRSNGIPLPSEPELSAEALAIRRGWIQLGAPRHEFPSPTGDGG